MPDVRMPDGTVIKNVPDGITKQELMSRLQGAGGDLPAVPNVQGDTEEPQAGPGVAIPQFSGTGTPEAPPFDPIEDPTFLQGVGREFLRRLAGNAGAIPGQIIEGGAPRGEPVLPTGAPSLFGPVVGNAMELAGLVAGQITGQDIPAQGQQAAADLTGALSGENALAAVRVPEQVANIFTGEPVQSFSQLQDTERGITRKFAEDAPVGTAIGGVLGDVATIAAGRKAVGAGAPAVQEAVQRAIAPAVVNGNTAVMRMLQTVANTATKAGVRAARTGTEAAFLGSLQGKDPAEVGRNAATAQLGGDVLAGLLAKGKRIGYLRSVGNAALIGLAIDQFLIPGGLNRILPNIEGANKGVIIGTLLGAAGGAAFKDIPASAAGPGFAALANTLKRGAIVSLLNSAAKSPETVGPIIQKYRDDPFFFGGDAQRKIERAINSDKIDLSNTINRLMKNPKFRKKFEELSR